MSVDESGIRKKIYRYCAYQERCHSEVRQKLISLGVPFPRLDEFVAELITQGFLNEERFARTFAGGKFRLKRWGRVKIANELKRKGLNDTCIRIGLSELEPADYETALKGILQKKLAELSDGLNVFVMRDRAARYAIQKGFEPNLVWSLLEGMTKATPKK